MTIKLVVSDCDGTLVTPDKKLTDAARKAVARLHAAGIGFTLVSSRPSFGMRMLIAPCDLRLPFGAFNGSSIVGPDFAPLVQTVIAREVVARSLAVLQEFDVDVWLFSGDSWLIARDGDYVPNEKRTIETEPTVVQDFSLYLDRVCKVVGVGADPEKLARCEAAMQGALGDTAHAARSQSYYLDVTPRGHDKGTFVDAMAKRLGVTRDEIATLGDMRNDLPMFRRSGISIAMGNAPDDVKAQASRVTASNREDGFAKAINELLDENR